YITLVHGVLDRMKGEIDLPIGRHPIKRKKMSVRDAGGRNALTLWKKVEEIVDMFSLLVITLKTGRTHQIRVHLSHIGHPIVGDHVYGMKKRWWGENNLMAAYVRSSIARQMLHAEALGFIHPDTGKYCEFEAPIPEDMEYVINCLRHVGVKDKNA
ncbi:MAG: RluA family pseudouridine synthase, partial [Deltaproteobacteria bacterium]|nr:RluA family pseudouridine synthase [Deltaproteobacteria bacterium]